MTTLALAVPDSPARFRDLLAAEWLKLRSLRSTAWSLVIGALAVIGFNVGAAYDQYRAWPQYDAAGQADFVRSETALLHAFTGTAGTVLVLCISAIGAVTVVGEYSTGLIRTTFAAVPARGSVMAAKVTVVAAVTTVFGACVAAASFGLSQSVLSARHIGLPIDHPGALRMVVASALLAPVSALIGMAVGAVVRHSATTVVTTVVLLLLLPLVFSDDRHWTAVIDHTMPFSAWQRLTHAGAYEVAHPWSIAGAWTVYALWALVAAVLTVIGVRRRDQ